jgi:glycosyltransferase involved in cell wall biosynthesis
MRVIHVAPTPFGRAGLFGGGERYPFELARALAAHVDCELISFGTSTQHQCESSGLRITTLRALGWLQGHPAQPIAPSLIGALSGASVVHTHHLRSLPSRMAAITGRLRHQRLAVTDHGLAGGTWGGVLPRLFDLFLPVSEYSAREQAAPAHRTRVIYGGADPDRYSPDPNVSRQGVLFVGRLTPHKGLDRLLQALPPGATTRIVGSAGHDPHPPERDYPRLLRQLARDRDVHFLGPISDDELPAVYRSSGVFVLPSVDLTCYGKKVAVSELLGLSILEAMASGTPVVASAIGGVPEIVRDGETGFLVPPGDVDALRDRLAQVLGDPLLARRLGASARQSVLDRFTWSRVAQRCLEAYAQTPLTRRSAS